MKILKYNLDVTDLQSVPMPEGAVILTAQCQFNEIFLWAHVNPSEPVVNRTIEIIVTGYEYEGAERAYIGTVQQHGGQLIWHIFERL